MLSQGGFGSTELADPGPPALLGCAPTVLKGVSCQGSPIDYEESSSKSRA